MKIIMICGSLEPGMDGVGDYTRRLAGELIREGHLVSILAFNDNRVENIQRVFQMDKQTPIAVLRLPANLNTRIQNHEAKEFIDAHDPEWLSLQFVPFSFNKKGLPLSLGWKLKKLGESRKWHIMFHELWVGHANAKYEKKYWIGFLQRKGIRTLRKKLNVLSVNTHSDYYQHLLSKENINSGILPLFGNIEVVVKDTENAWQVINCRFLRENPSEKPLYEKDYQTAVIFGSFQLDWNPCSILNKWDLFLKDNNKEGLLLLIGRHGFPVDELVKKWNRTFNKIKVIELGVLPPHEISQIMQEANFAITPTPLAVIQKSGTVAAFIEHGLPVVYTRIGKINHFEIPQFKPKMIFFSESLKKTDFLKLKRIKPSSGLKNTASLLINNLSLS